VPTNGAGYEGGLLLSLVENGLYFEKIAKAIIVEIMTPPTITAINMAIGDVPTRDPSRSGARSNSGV
jgi:hypothetical protein